MFPAILMGPLVKLGFYLIGGMVVVGIVLGAYSVWKRGIVAEANQVLIIKQLEQAVKEAAKAAEDREKLRKAVDALSKDVQEQIDKSDKVLDAIEGEIDGAEDRPSSDVLKNTIRNLGSQ